MNIMLVSVTERTKGSVFAKRWRTSQDIVRQFCLNLMLTLLGGILGVVLAVGISRLLMFLIPSIPATIPTGRLCQFNRLHRSGSDLWSLARTKSLASGSD